MIKSILIIWIGGGFGSVLRFLMQNLAVKYFHTSFPLGTFLVNIIGCFFIGIFFGISEKQGWMTSEWRLFLITGICGGFTTFSSFSYDGISLLRQGDYLYFGAYLILSVGLGLLATFFGNMMIK